MKTERKEEEARWNIDTCVGSSSLTGDLCSWINTNNQVIVEGINENNPPANQSHAMIIYDMYIYVCRPQTVDRTDSEMYILKMN